MRKQLFAALLLPLAGYSQAGLYNAGVLQINGSTTLSTTSSFTNAATAGLTNNGQLYVSGELSNSQANMPAGAGTLYLNGSAQQLLTGTAPFNAFNLVTANSTGILLQNDLVVSGVHTFTAGRILSSATPNYLVYEAGSDYSGESHTRHVEGWVKKRGSNQFVFPVGNGTSLRPLLISNLSATSEFACRYSGATPNVNSPLSPLVSINPNEHWDLDQLWGGTAEVTLNWDHMRVPFAQYSLSFIRAARFSGGYWTNAGGTATGTVSGTGSITTTAQSSFGKFAIGSTSFPVPLRFVRMEGLALNGANRITWATANEAELLRFELERSQDGLFFQSIATLPARNLPAATYSFNDAGATSPVSYYRVKAIEQAGAPSYSTVIRVGAQTTFQVGLIENPVRGALRLHASGLPGGRYSYQISNSAGQRMRAGTFTYAPGQIVELSPAGGLRPGTYRLLLQLPKPQTLSFIVL
jgi:hypothetical protein